MELIVKFLIFKMMMPNAKSDYHIKFGTQNKKRLGTFDTYNVIPSFLACKSWISEMH